MQHLRVLFLFMLAQANGNNITPSPTKERIIGGQVVDIQQYPYMVSLHRKNYPICAGSIIAPDAIMTAAHCTHKRSASEFTVHSGSNSADQGTLHQVKEIQQHPYFNINTASYDISILIITPPITYSNSSQPIKLATERPADNTILVASGWGRLEEDVRPTIEQRQNLRAVFLTAVNHDECSQVYKRRKVNSLMMCAAAAMDKGTCKGDSGGPLVNTNTMEQVGITSWSKGCATPNYPGVFASVPDLLDFIEPGGK